jgi:hypothetical protein
MKILNLKISTMIMRLHLMSAIMVTLGFLGFLYAGIIIGMLIFLATLMGIRFNQLNPFRHVSRSDEYEWQKHHHPVHH